jgi:hypothetical protein
VSYDSVAASKSPLFSYGADLSGITLGGGAATGQTGELGNGAVLFDGVDDYGQVAIDLSAQSKIVVAVLADWTSYGNNDHLMMEFASPWFSNVGSFIVDPNSTGVSGKFYVGFVGAGGTFRSIAFDRPAAGEHLYHFVFDYGAVGNAKLRVYVDAVEVTATSRPETDNVAGTFANSTLNVMSRGGSSLFGAGTVERLHIFADLSEADMAEMQAARTASGPDLSPIGDSADFFYNETPAARLFTPDAWLISGLTWQCVEAMHGNGIAKIAWSLDGATFTDVTTRTSRNYTDRSASPERCGASGSRPTPPASRTDPPPLASSPTRTWPARRS